MPKKRSFLIQILSSNQVWKSFLKTSCWYFSKPSFYLFLILTPLFSSSSWYFLCITRVNFGALWTHSFGFRKQNGDLVLWKKIVLFHRSKKKSTTTFVRSGKKCTATTKRSINAYAQKTFQNPGWVPERKATNPFLNLLLRKNEKGHR